MLPTVLADTRKAYWVRVSPMSSVAYMGSIVPSSPVLIIMQTRLMIQATITVLFNTLRISSLVGINDTFASFSLVVPLPLIMVTEASAIIAIKVVARKFILGPLLFT